MRGLFAAAALVAGAHAIDPIVIKGSKFFYKTNGTQFFMKGVAYQQEYKAPTSSSPASSLQITDPLADAAACNRDIPYMKKLQTNTIRVYAIDPTKDHSACMNAFAAAGIYVVADLSDPAESINRDFPSWTTTLFQRYTSVVDDLMKYDNTLGFFAGNEVSNQPNNTMASAFVKAAVRDTKAYIKSKNYRPIGVGYATNDDANIRVNLANYFDCGNSTDGVDFLGYNIYSWCGDSSFTQSGYDVRTKEFEHFNIPVFFAEFGCNDPSPRIFTEVGAIYGPNMTGVWSGAICYMYFEEENHFGLVSVSGGKVTTNQDFDNLAKQMAKATPVGVKEAAYTPTNTSPAVCPSVTPGMWEAVSSPLPPVVNAPACSCMVQTLSCVVADNVQDKDYGDMFGFICGQKKGQYCQGINTNATAAPYGPYSMCPAKDQLSYVLNAYAKAVPGGCSFKGKATTKTPVPNPTGCSGTAAVSPVPQGSSPGGAGSGSTPGAAKPSPSANSTGAGTALVAPGFNADARGMGLIVVGAMMSGMAMILL
ncbi:hypothetical protein ACEQ8H_008187 [Pleosporales sp. CAS-2024a]